MKSITYLTLCMMVLSLCNISCSNDNEKIMPEEEFRSFVSGKYFNISDGYWLKQIGSGLQESDETIDGLGPITTSTFWFIDGNTLLIPTILDGDVGENSLRFRWNLYLNQKGEDIMLFVKSEFKYDSSTGQFSTNDQSLVREKSGNSYYIEKMADKEFTMRIEFNNPVQAEIVGYRSYNKEEISPDLRPNYPYKVFDSNDEAMAYVKEMLGE